MSIRERLDADMKEALRARDARRLNCIRMLKSKLLEREVALRGQHGKDYRIADEEALSVIAAYAKQRGDSIEGYRQGGRDDLVAAEQAELELVRFYLPEPLSEAALRGIIGEAIATSGARSAQDLGAVMKLVAPRTKGLADGRVVNQLVRSMLAGS